MSQPKFMSVKEFRENGYLQELNRRFLHPLGLAIEVNVDPHGHETLGRIWDSREDLEGIIFGEGMIDPVKAEHVLEVERERAKTRIRALGYSVQPVKPFEPQAKIYQPVFSGVVVDSEDEKITIYKHVDKEEELFLELSDGVLHALPPGSDVYTRFDMDSQKFHVKINSLVWTGEAIGDKWQLLAADAR